MAGLNAAPGTVCRFCCAHREATHAFLKGEKKRQRDISYTPPTIAMHTETAQHTHKQHTHTCTHKHTCSEISPPTGKIRQPLCSYHHRSRPLGNLGSNSSYEVAFKIAHTEPGRSGVIASGASLTTKQSNWNNAPREREKLVFRNVRLCLAWPMHSFCCGCCSNRFFLLCLLSNTTSLLATFPISCQTHS